MPFVAIPFAIALVSIALTVASTAYQIMQAKKAKKKAKKAEESRKGFELVIDGSVEPLPIVYGKAKIGGVRVYHNTSPDFKYAAPNSDKILQTGPPAVPSTTYSGVQYYNTEGQPIYGEVVIPEKPSGLLIADKSGTKNEFLYFQQAICQGPIAAVWDVIIDDNRYLSDPEFGTQPDKGDSNGIVRNVKAAMRIDIHNEGNEADALMTKVFSERASAVFTGVAYANVIIRLDRDAPQFSNVPNIQYLIEGRKVRTVIAGVLGGTYAYSNNPAWCLLDYLLDDVGGKGLTADDINLPSFEAAAAICATIVQSDVAVGGLLYQPSDGARNITTRSLPLYECNLVVDVTQTVRDNVETLLSTMGDARLVWSAGKYKLLLQYPLNNEAIALATTFTDDDLLLEQEIEIKWPSSEERLNNCTVRFNNESENFKEDSVSWPSKVTGSILRGIGGKKYPIVGGWDESRSHNNLLNAYGVWEGHTADTTLVWKFKAPETGTYAVKFIVDNSGSITVAGISTLNATYPAVAVSNISLVADTIYTITIQAHDAGLLKGAAATFIAPNGNIAWTTRSDAYSDFITVTASNAVYQTMLTEDGGVELETDIFEAGITDYYHALAKAEEMVRTSRSAFGIKFQYKISNVYLEPGDIVKLQSATLELGFSGDVFIRVNEIKVLEGAIGEVTGTRFDYTQLAWAVKDDEYLKPKNAYDFGIPRPEWITFTPEFNAMKNSSGTLEWATVSDPRVVNYILYVHLHSDVDSQGFPIFKELGRTPLPPFYLPLFNAASAMFGVRSLTAAGATSEIQVIDSLLTAPLLYDPNIARLVNLQASNIAFIKSLSGAFNVPNSTLTAVLSGFSAPTYKWYVDDVLIEGQTAPTLVISAFEPPLNKVYRVEVREQLAPNNVFEGVDYMTIFSISEGASTLNMTFSNESVNILADVNGVIFPANQLPYAITTGVARGAAVLNSGVSFTKIDDGCISTIHPTTGAISITAVSQPYASIVVSATVGTDTVSRVISINKNLQGSTVIPRLARIQTSSGAFVTHADNSVSPTTITLLDASVGYDTPTRKWYVDNVLQGGTGSSFILSPFAPGGATKIVKLEISESDLSFLNYDEIAIFAIKEGSDAWGFTLSDLVKSIPANSAGVVYPGVLPYTVDAIVYKGLENYTTGQGVVYALENISGLSATIDSATGIMTVTAISAASASVDIRATHPASGATGAHRYTTTKVLDGATGDPGTPGVDSYSLNLSTVAKHVNADSSGNIKVGQLPFTINTIVKKGLVPLINPAITFAVDSYTNLTGSIAVNGDVTITGMSAEEGKAVIRATEVATGVTGTIILNVFKVRDGVTQDVQALLTAGVTNVVAGVGSGYTLNVNTAAANIIMAANGTVYKGTAAAGVTRQAIGISAAGIAMGYNRSSDGVWQDSVAIDSLGNVTIAGTLTASSIISSSATLSSGETLATVKSNAQAGVDISNALLVSGTSVLRGVLVPTDSGAIKTGSITWNATTGAWVSGSGVAITEAGIIGANGSLVTFSIDTSGNATFRGNISGGANIDITGTGKFGGSTTSSFGSTAILANSAETATNGIVATGNSGSGGTGVLAIGAGLAVALDCRGKVVMNNTLVVSGTITASNAATVNGTLTVNAMTKIGTTTVTNLSAEMWNGIKTVSLGVGSSIATQNLTKKPGSASTNQWWTINLGGVNYYIPIWT